MNLNSLTFKTERVNLEQDDGFGKYLAFRFYIDGICIRSEEYNPADYDDILNKYAFKHKLVVITHCNRKDKGCSSLVAKVVLKDDIVEWTVKNLRHPKNSRRFYFAKDEYEKTMAQLYNTARLEKININATKKTFFIKMEIEDAFSIFWNEEDSCIGNDNKLTLKNGKDINFYIPDFYEWANNYMRNALIPCETGKISVEELNKTFDWKAFHKQGIAIAVKVKKLLPKNVVLKYASPFEEQSGLLPAEVLIDSDPWYVENVLKKLCD